jgi:hypothetical protein
MTKKAIYIAVFGLLAGSAGVAYVMADEPPADMQVVQAPTPKASPAPVAAATQAAQDHAHRQGMDHGAEQMHDGMMQDHQQGMQNMQQQGMGGMAPQGGQAGMPMQPGKDCCAGKGMKPSGQPMPMPSDKAMPMKDM